MAVNNLSSIRWLQHSISADAEPPIDFSRKARSVCIQVVSSAFDRYVGQFLVAARSEGNEEDPMFQWRTPVARIGSADAQVKMPRRAGESSRSDEEDGSVQAAGRPQQIDPTEKGLLLQMLTLAQDKAASSGSSKIPSQRHLWTSRLPW